MSSSRASRSNILDRRNFLRGAGSGLAAGVLLGSAATKVEAQGGQQATPEPITHAGVFRADDGQREGGPHRFQQLPDPLDLQEPRQLADKETVAKMKRKYGEITMLDFPAFTKKTFPGVTKMDMWSSLFGDMDDKSQFVQTTINGYDGKPRQVTEFDPSATSSKRWLEKMANVQAKEGVFCHHISNNAPRDICELDESKRKAGVEVAKKWLDGAAMIGAKSMRVNSGGPRIAPWPSPNASSYPEESGDRKVSGSVHCVVQRDGRARRARSA